MKIHFFAIVVLSSVLSAFAAETTITLKNVHLCCGACVEGVESSVKNIEGVTVKADEDSGIVTLTSSDKAKLQKAADAMAEGGYFGVSDKSDFKPVAKTGAKGEKVQSLTVGGAHLCCPGCVKAVDRAVKATPGATGHTATKNAATFVVNGDFNDQQFFEALQKEGLSARIVKTVK